MIFNSFQFLWLFPLVFVGYYALCSIPRIAEKTKHYVANISLIVLSYWLYALWNPAYALLLLGVTAITYLAALCLDGNGLLGNACKGLRRRRLMAAFTVLALLPLLIFKYYNFINTNVTAALAYCGMALELPGLNWAVPVGISFFSFQAVGYMVDVYYGRVRAERNWWHYMLFVSFFPQIMCGPISKADILLPQIRACRPFRYEQAVGGLKLLLWGMFLKVVMADRLGVYVDAVYNAWAKESGASCLIASFAYSLQIYGDFGGYSFMAIGVGKLLGFDLMTNFRRPVFSVSIGDYWRRWHISLSTWLKYCVYIPLGGSRCAKWRAYLNLFLTFSVSGVWHGANWTYITWGLMHGTFLCLEKALGITAADKQGRSIVPSLFRWQPPKALVRVLRILITFFLVTLTRVFFRSATVADGWSVTKRIFSSSLSSLPQELTHCYALVCDGETETIFALLAVLVVLASEAVQEFLPGRAELLHSRYVVVRWTTYVLLLSAIIVFGVFGSRQFIYANF